jgi:uncharacterized surface anchored protein
MKVKIITVLFVLISFCSCVKDENRVRGSVTYKDALTSITYEADNAKIDIRLASGDYVYQTIYADADGNYDYYPLENGDYNIIATYSDGIYSYTCAPVLFTVKKDMVQNINLNLE